MRPWSSFVVLVTVLLLLCACAPIQPVASGEVVTPLPPPPLARSVAIAAGLTPVSPLPLPVASAANLTTTLTITNSPTFTPTPPLVLLPTPTPDTALPTATATPDLAAPDLVLLPTPTPTAAQPAGEIVVLPTPTPTLAPAVAVVAPVTSTPTLTATAELAPPVISAGLPPAYIAQGSYASTTLYTDTTTLQQQGSFTIVQATAANIYGFDQQITLTTRRGDGSSDEMRVYVVSDHILVNYGRAETAGAGSTWAVVRRDEGSGLVRAIQPITDLAMLFPRVVDQAELIGPEQVAGQDTLHYRIQGQSAVGARLVQPLLAISGEFRALQLDAWLAIPGGYMVRYSFQVDLANARVLDANRQEVRADQAVTWTYQLTTVEAPLTVTWPAAAPRPDSWPVPGFAPGDFPTPPDTTFISLVENVVELSTPAAAGTVADFYRAELTRLGWTVEGDRSLLRCSKGAESFELLLVEEGDTGTTITLIPVAPTGG